MLWLVEHWRLAAGLVVALALVAFGWWLHKPAACPSCAPAVHAVEQVHEQRQVKAQRETEQTQGPTRKVVLEFDPHCPPAVAPPAACAPGPVQLPFPGPGSGFYLQPMPGLVRETITESGTRTTETRAATETKAEEDRHVELQVTPAAAAESLPRFSVFFEPRLRPSAGIGVVGGGVRLTRDVWLEGWAEPSAPAFGVGVRITF